jgi:hypothetical protein
MLKMLVLISIDKPTAKGISQVSYYTYDYWGCPLVALSNLFNLTKTRKKVRKITTSIFTHSSLSGLLPEVQKQIVQASAE